MASLDEIKPGQECRIIKVNIGGATGQRLMDMGFMPGTKVKVVRNAPLIDPVDFYIRGYHVSLRHSEARGIEVEPL
ncbi:iron transporter FeoA [Candidatus Desulfofervidus auxilii]|uniref:Iron transporter FeoA n=1 Tax=Desulfofervidus auxilii TaxID=1621989 RepID=A0A7U4QKY7_DESA2|nr:ferrous iron transport protein A [Candidatus Desulfofervidus auxilii]AMM41267.1 iron transporter FeoA [Candidatus Desulfofervidus auxilii]